MSNLQSEFVELAAGIFVCAAGLLASAVSAFRLKTRDYTLLNFGLFAFLYGLRGLVESQTMETMVGYPFTVPYFHGLLTYLLIIPLSALLVDLFGRGWQGSLVWVFRSTIVYAVVAVCYDLIRPGPSADAGIYRPLAVVWGLVWIVNVLLSRKERDLESRVLQGVFLATFLFMVIDQLISIGTLTWKIQLEQPGQVILFAGLGFVAVHHFFINEQKLQSIEQEIEIARRIQESNLPATLKFPGGLDIAARYVPMSAVAGDFYDIQTTDGSGVGILIADVSGHGVGAALIGSMLKVCFASQAPHLADPAHVLTEINRILQGKIKDSFVTACSVFIDFKREILRYAIAGYPPPYLQRTSTGEMIRLTCAGTILGPFPGTVYESEELHIASGDRLVLYTDGLVETAGKGGAMFGEDRLEAMINACSNDSPENSAGHIVEQVIKWSGRSGGRSLDDDLTLIVADVFEGPPLNLASQDAPGESMV